MSRKCTRRIEWDAAHRVLEHESKCKFLHGHRYKADITIKTSALDELGRVVDFSWIKTQVGGWVEENWDHNALFNSRDVLAVSKIVEDLGKAPFLFEKCNPTAENIAEILFAQTLGMCRAFVMVNHNGGVEFHDKDDLADIMRPEKIVVWETPNCWAEMTYEDFEHIQNAGWGITGTT